MPNNGELAKHYRLRAEEVRTIAQGIFDGEERKKLMQIADEFEQLARGVEEKTRRATT